MIASNSVPEVIRCSFCNKSQDLVAKIIACPKELPRAYICDECVVVCNGILSAEGVPDHLMEPHEVKKLFADCENQTRQKLAAVYNHYKRIYEHLRSLDSVTFERTPSGTSDDVSLPLSSPDNGKV